MTTTDNDSLESKYYNKYINKILEKVEFTYELISDDAFATDSCHCEEHSFYVLGTYYTEDTSPILCGDCGKEIALTKVPYVFKEDEHFTILSYQRMYNSVENVWMSSLSDRFTKRQLTYHDSQLSKRGVEICRELENKIGKPVYFLLPVYKNHRVFQQCNYIEFAHFYITLLIALQLIQLVIFILIFNTNFQSCNLIHLSSPFRYNYSKNHPQIRDVLLV
ncbi:DUF2310 family Zn-ribbon-containing protein [Mycoplasmatota bacterium]|nr:DUF2310 family Zn-ribbon-containing protein [Mycoplasmatota bacterium]